MFNLKFKTGNAAFSDYKEYEIERILKEVITQVNNGYTEKSILDINGNVIGKWSITE
jgi:hypothetical protein